MRCTASVAIKCALALVQGEGGGFKFVLNDIPFYANNLPVFKI